MIRRVSLSILLACFVAAMTTVALTPPAAEALPVAVLKDGELPPLVRETITSPWEFIGDPQPGDCCHYPPDCPPDNPNCKDLDKSSG